ncbi:MAG: discoidin domain-containing protein, partial [Ruminococcaceae bacterium]|nr:discoidin domain-containing protein [Oscillospiraceae bacterium]
TTSGIIDLTAAEILAQDAQSFTYAAVRTQIPLNEFNTVYAIVPYVKNGSIYTFGKQTEASYAGLKTVGNFLYPTEGTWEVKSEDFARTIGSKTYLDVAAAASVTPVSDDWSALLPEDEENYYFAENTVCPVDADTMYRVIGNNCVGAGAIKWTEFEYVGYVQNPDQYDGVLPVSKMDDPLYVQMCLPNEVASPMGTAGRSDVRTPQGRINASNLFAVTDHINALPIGAIFLNPEKGEIPDDAQVTLCFGNITLCARTVDSDGWFLASQRLCQPANFFPFPWTLPIDGYRLRDSQQSVVDGHYEVKLTGAELKGKKFDDDRVVTGILHFWGDFLYYDIGDVLGMASSYVVWVKEPEWSGYLTADIGADIRRADGSCDQAFTGINYEITDEPRLVFGHNVGPKAYDEVMDSEKVLELIEWDKYKSRNSLVMREHNNSGKQEICPISATTTARSEGMWYVGQGEISSIIDGNDNTFFMRKWVDIADCTTFDLTLDGYYDLETARIVWGGSNENCAVATAYDVYVSADGVLYTKAASVTGNTDRGEDWHRTDRLPMQAEKVKYVRLCVYGQNPNTVLSLAEVSFEGWASRAPGEKIYPTAIQSSESHSSHPTANLTDGNTETYWRIGEWQQGSESAAKHTDAVLTAELPYKTNLTSVDFSLISYFPEGETNFYTRHSLIKAFEIEVSENGVDYRKVYRFDGEAKATISIGEALRTDGFSVKDFTGSVKNVKYIRITFKNHYRLALNDLCVRGNESVTFR